ncbi:hypothetical protein [Brucella haematophila]|uniref:Uncharacterized protein n=1 Tax=Brucella haematophila TaxID=419474 RepID=A0ABX1DLL3_9HYPH|nr:hypothetical protein [Brucella haematophila]NKC03867.1 hypothetical protein [Brucella haematophila]TMV00702.1 hypothetical protein FGI60_16305 [Brucella haematophila]
MTQKSKGPAEAATSNPGDVHLTQQGKKNMDTNSTEIPSQARQRVPSLYDLETPICELKTFLYMLQVVWEGMPIEKIRRFPSDKLLICSNDRSEAISFSILEAQEKARDVFSLWEKLVEEKRASV